MGKAGLVWRLQVRGDLPKLEVWPYRLIDGGNVDGIEYVEAKPKSPDSGFDQIRIGFKENLPRTMELHDSFGQMTQLTFDTFERNPAIDMAARQAVPSRA